MAKGIFKGTGLEREEKKVRKGKSKMEDEKKQKRLLRLKRTVSLSKIDNTRPS